MIQGVYTALVTPFANGEVDYDALRKIVEMQVAAGIDGILPTGTTGESPTLSVEEHLKVIDFVQEVIAGRCKLMAGTGANSTEEAIRLTMHAKEIGADCTLQVTPYYNKPSQEGLYRHFATVADRCGVPVVLYNVPGRTGVPIAVDTIARLSKNSNIVAVKEAAGSVERVSEILSVCDITVMSGDDSLTLPMMSVGAKGVISVASNVIPDGMKKFVTAIRKGDFAEALKYHRKYFRLFKHLFIETNPIPVKAAMAMIGLMKEEYRLPLCEISASNKEILRNTLEQALKD